MEKTSPRNGTGSAPKEPGDGRRTETGFCEPLETRGVYPTHTSRNLRGDQMQRAKSGKPKNPPKIPPKSPPLAWNHFCHARPWNPPSSLAVPTLQAALFALRAWKTPICGNQKAKVPGSVPALGPVSGIKWRESNSPTYPLTCSPHFLLLQTYGFSWAAEKRKTFVREPRNPNNKQATWRGTNTSKFLETLGIRPDWPKPLGVGKPLGFASATFLKPKPLGSSLGGQPLGPGQ